MHILNTLAPVFLIIALGAALRLRGFISAAMHLQMNKLAYWVATPCLLFLKIGASPPAAGSAAVIARAMMFATLLLCALAFAVSLALRQPGRSTGALVHAAFRGNLAFVGLPVVIFAFSGHPEAARAEAGAALALGPVVVGYNVLAVAVLLLSQHRFSAAALANVVKKIVANPLVIACVAGLLWNRLVQAQGISLPVVLDRVLATLGYCALPLALLGVGASLVSTPLRSSLVPASCAALLKVAIGPLAGWLMASLCGADGLETQVTCLLMACPSAIVSYVLTDQLGGDAGLCASAIVVSTVLSALSLASVLLLIG